jgi:hypothetical protein
MTAHESAAAFLSRALQASSNSEDGRPTLPVPSPAGASARSRVRIVTTHVIEFAGAQLRIAPPSLEIHMSDRRLPTLTVRPTRRASDERIGPLPTPTGIDRLSNKP